jgi:hypothetical protein
MVLKGDYIVQQPYLPEDKQWYVQRVSLLDYGRFDTEEEAIKHRQFCEEQWSEDIF